MPLVITIAHCNLHNNSTTPLPITETISAFLKQINLPLVDKDTLNQLSCPFTITEIEQAISTLPSHKSPGADGSSNEFYKGYSQFLSTLLAAVFSSAADTGTFPEEMLNAIIVTIPKPHKDPTLVSIYRLISLLFSRLLKIIPDLVHPDHVGFVTGRQA